MSGDQEVREAVNALLHRGFDAEPCESACTHVVHGRWTALGIANVIARQQAIEGDARASARSLRRMRNPYAPSGPLQEDE